MARQLSRRRPVNPEPEEDDEDGIDTTDEADSGLVDGQGSRPRRRRSRDEDEEEARPSRKRRRSSRDDAEEAPDEDEDEVDRFLSRARRNRPEDDDFEDERPARRQRRRAPVDPDDDPDEPADDEDERPARRTRFKGRRADADYEKEADEAISRNRRKSKRPESAGKSSLRDGWGDGKMKSRDFDKERFTVAEEDTDYVFRFAEEKPIASWNEHFLRNLPQGTRKSYVCAEDECPICQYLSEEGEKDGVASFRRAFNVIVFDKNGNPEVKYWVTTPAPLGEIEKFAFDEEWTGKHGPLNNPKTYFKISKYRKSKKEPFKFRLDFIRSRDLEEEENIVPLTTGELEELEDDFFIKKDVVKVDDLDALYDIVEELDK